MRIRCAVYPSPIILAIVPPAKIVKSSAWAVMTAMVRPSYGLAFAVVAAAAAALARNPRREIEFMETSPVPDHQHVSVLDNVFLAFEAQQPFLADTWITGMIDERLPVDDLGANEFLLEVGMNRAGGLHRRAADGNRPGAYFRFSGGEKRHQAH